MSKVKVGIVMPSFNQAKYIDRAIESVIANKQYANIFFAVIDGGSTDGTVDILRKYDRQIDYWHSKEDKGQADAINQGVSKLVKCEYVMWLNSDDVYQDEHAVEKILNYTIEHQLDLCYGKSHFINNDDEILGGYETRPYSDTMLSEMCYISQPSVIIRKKAWDDVGGLNTSLHMCMDYELWIRLAQDYTIGYYDDYVGNTRIYEETKTSKAQLQNLNEGIAILNHYYGKVPDRWIRDKLYFSKGTRCNNRFIRMILRLSIILLRKVYVMDAEKKSAVQWLL